MSKKNARGEELPVHKSVERLIRESRANFTRSQRRSSFDDSRPRRPVAWRSDSSPRHCRSRSPLKRDSTALFAYRRVSLPSSSPYVPRRAEEEVGDCEFSAASAIRAGRRPIYSNRSLRASSEVNVRCENISTFACQPASATPCPESKAFDAQLIEGTADAIEAVVGGSSGTKQSKSNTGAREAPQVLEKKFPVFSLHGILKKPDGPESKKVFRFNLRWVEKSRYKSSSGESKHAENNERRASKG